MDQLIRITSHHHEPWNKSKLAESTLLLTN